MCGSSLLKADHAAASERPGLSRAAPFSGGGICAPQTHPPKAAAASTPFPKLCQAIKVAKRTLLKEAGSSSAKEAFDVSSQAADDARSMLELLRDRVGKAAQAKSVTKRIFA